MKEQNQKPKTKMIMKADNNYYNIIFMGEEKNETKPETKD